MSKTLIVAVVLCMAFIVLLVIFAAANISKREDEQDRKF